MPRARCITEDLWLLVPALVHITGGGARAGAVHRTFGYDTGHRCLGGDHGRADDGAPAGEPVVHKVRAGQNPTTIAREYNVTVNELFQWNNWSKDHVLQVGESVKVYPKKRP